MKTSYTMLCYCVYEHGESDLDNLQESSETVRKNNEHLANQCPIHRPVQTSHNVENLVGKSIA